MWINLRNLSSAVKDDSSKVNIFCPVFSLADFKIWSGIVRRELARVTKFAQLSYFTIQTDDFRPGQIQEKEYLGLYVTIAPI